jgi:hypothetical protein
VATDDRGQLRVQATDRRQHQLSASLISAPPPSTLTGQ